MNCVVKSQISMSLLSPRDLLAFCDRLRSSHLCDLLASCTLATMHTHILLHLQPALLQWRPFSSSASPQRRPLLVRSHKRPDQLSTASRNRCPLTATNGRHVQGRSLQTKALSAQTVYELADIDAKTAGTIAQVLGPLLAIGQLLMIIRIVLTWYPNINGNKLPWAIAVKPTEPVLAPTRKVIPIVGGLDVTPIVWVAFLSFSNEILLGPQGILNLLQRKVDL